MCLAIPGEILSIEGDDVLLRKSRVSFGGVIKEVSLACLPEAKVGEYVLVHAGIAISKIDEDEAEKVFQALEDLGALEEVD
mgnify:CR=1 FL=1